MVMKYKIMLIDPDFKEGLKGFPLGLAYIAGALRDDYEVSVLDLTARAIIENRTSEEILQKELRKQNPDIIGITSTSPTHKNALKVAKIIKEYRDIPIIKGGPHEINSQGTTIKNNPEIDYSVIGEGEETIIKLIDKILKGESIKGLEGVIYRENNEIVNNGDYYPASYDQPHDLNLVMNYRFSRRISFSTNFTYSTGRPITYPVSTYYFDGQQFIEYSDYYLSNIILFTFE